MMPMGGAQTLSYLSDSPDATRDVAARLAGPMLPGDFIAIEGDLGAGKTCFVQGLCAALGCDEGVRSPTFVLLHHYPVRPPIRVVHHFDLYRVDSVSQLEDIGYDEFFFSDGICVVEWAQRCASVLPADRLVVRLESAPRHEEARDIQVLATGERSRQVLKALMAHDSLRA